MEKPVIQRPASSRLRSTVSLSSKPQVAEQQQVEQQSLSNSRPDKPFGFEQLQQTWHAFARLRKQQFDSMSEALIFNREITLDGTTVHIALDNNIQANLMVDLKPELLAYLRDQLQNKQIQVEHRVVVPDTKKMIYTPQDRFNYLAAKNPALLDLRNALNLDVDF